MLAASFCHNRALTSAAAARLLCELDARPRQWLSQTVTGNLGLMPAVVSDNLRCLWLLRGVASMIDVRQGDEPRLWPTLAKPW